MRSQHRQASASWARSARCRCRRRPGNPRGADPRVHTVGVFNDGVVDRSLSVLCLNGQQFPSGVCWTAAWDVGSCTAIGGGLSKGCRVQRL